MIVASGFVEANRLNDVKKVLSEFKSRCIKVNEVNQGKILFLIEKENMGALKAELDSLRNIEYVKDVYLAYYSLEEAE
jgi:nitrate reductase NapAB chaperone NapD